jgi:iron complex transport system substrate-binding protein
LKSLHGGKTVKMKFMLFIAAFVLSACAGPVTATTAILPTEPPTEVPTTIPTEAPTEVPEPAVIELTDALGREFVFDGPVQRVVSLAPSNTEILFAVGAGAQVVGREEFSDYPEEALEVPSIGSTFGDINLEAILGLEPDLILAADINPPEQIQAMEDVDLQVFVLGNPADFNDLFSNLKTVGILTGHESESQELVDNLQARYESVLAALEGVEPTTVFYEIDGSDSTAPWTTGSGTFQQLLFDLAGGDNIASDIEGWGQMSLEEIVVRDPDVIVFATGPFVPTTVDTLRARAGWEDITAVLQGQVYGVDTDLIDLPGPRLIEGLEMVAKFLHSDLFE